MGKKNVFNIFFKTDEKEKLTGVCNVQRLSTAVYKNFVKNNHKICNKYVEFAPHPKSLDGIPKPSGEELTRLCFNDMNTALENTVEAMKKTHPMHKGKKTLARWSKKQ